MEKIPLEEPSTFKSKLLTLETQPFKSKMIKPPLIQDLEISLIPISGQTEEELSAGLGDPEELTEL